MENTTDPADCLCRIPAMAKINAVLADYIELREFMEEFVGQRDLLVNQAAEVAGGSTDAVKNR